MKHEIPKTCGECDYYDKDHHMAWTYGRCKGNGLIGIHAFSTPCQFAKDYAEAQNRIAELKEEIEAADADRRGTR